MSPLLSYVTLAFYLYDFASELSLIDYSGNPYVRLPFR